MVVCPEGSWGKGNVDIVTEKYHIETYPGLAEITTILKQKIKDFKQFGNSLQSKGN